MSFSRQQYLLIAWGIAFLATLGSLYFSNILHLPPCTLCWFQRIFMYPLVLILGAGLLLKDRNIAAYSLPASLIGWVISLYHVLIYYHVIPEKLVICTVGTPCTDRQLSLLGFISIPLLSFAAFTIIIVCLLMVRRQDRIHV